MKHSAFVGFPIDLRMEHRKACAGTYRVEAFGGTSRAFKGLGVVGPCTGEGAGKGKMLLHLSSRVLLITKLHRPAREAI